MEDLRFARRRASNTFWTGCAALVFAGCGASGPAQPTAAATASPSPRPSAAPTARYRLTFEATWSADSHPSEFPRNAHFSGLIGGTHRSTVTFWEVGGMATEGIRLMAERGRQTPLDVEINAAVQPGHAEQVLAGDDVPRSPGSATLDFQVSLDYPLVTMVSMVAPSPDWFVGVSGLSLLEDGDWATEKVVDLHPYDAGTDSGRTYTAPDEPTAPPQPIQRLTVGPVVVGGRVPPMGRFVFRRTS